MEKNRIINSLTNLFTDTYGLSSKNEVRESGAIVVTSDVTLNKVDDASVLIKILAYESGTSYISFIFNKLDQKTIQLDREYLKVLDIFNDINKNTMFKAYISDSGYVTLEVPIYDVCNEENLVDTTRMAIDDLVDDNFILVLNKLKTYLEE